MSTEIPLTPFVPWTPTEIEQRIACLPNMAIEDLRDLAESLSEGLEDIPPEMQVYYQAVRTEIASRQPLPIWDYDSRGPVKPEEQAMARENIRSMTDAELEVFIESLTMEPDEGELPASLVEELAWMKEERDGRRAAPPPPPET